VDWASSRWDFRAWNWDLYEDNSPRKDLILSVAFPCFEGLSSCLESSAYESIVREKEVREEAIWPCRLAGVVSGEEAKMSRSRRMEEDCLRAELKVEFCGTSIRDGDVIKRVLMLTMIASGLVELYALWLNDSAWVTHM